MKRCLLCDSVPPGDGWLCPACGRQPDVLEGFLAFAPGLAYGNDGFPSVAFEQLMELEERNFWFLARNDLIVWMLKHYFPGFRSLLEVGCGNGFVLKAVEQSFPDAVLQGSDLYLAGLSRASSRLRSATLIQMDATRMPFREEFDVVGAFDTLEHITEDRVALSQMHAALRRGGGILLSVPQHPWLWSAVDEYSCHVRRYTRTDLRRKLEHAGFFVERLTSFVASLVPLMFLRRRFAKTVDLDPTAELRIGGVPNRLLGLALAAERRAIQLGVNWPFGGSLFAVARKLA